jgi:RNAse (barnase) inhibitor barstar
MKTFIYTNNIDYPNNNSLIVHIECANSKKELLAYISEKLYFPEYFGFNWDALFDCLSDFHWIKEKNIILVHDILPNLSKSDFETYVKILFDCINDLDNCHDMNEHIFEVIFPTMHKNFIENILMENLKNDINM